MTKQQVKFEKTGVKTITFPVGGSLGTKTIAFAVVTDAKSGVEIAYIEWANRYFWALTNGFDVVE